MNKPFLILFNDHFATRAEVQSFLDQIPEINFWYGTMPNSVFVTGSLTAKQISTKLLEHFPTNSGRYLFVTEISADREGWMPKQLWHMLRAPDSPRLPTDD